MQLQKNILTEFRNKNVLITGGTGSIGMGLVKQLIKCKPRNIRILTNDENSIFDFRRVIGDNPIFTLMVGDIRDKDRLALAIRNIDFVFHAAAMKHVDICEQNPFDAIKTNVVGTSNILELAIQENISKFILISTDKATSPTSTLGASKLLAERLTRTASTYRGKGKTVFTVVRFGNVIGSRGSVFQIFLDQIRKGIPLTVTDKKMTRFIMSISEASKMILEVTTITKDGDIFILKMPSVKISELAKNMLQVYKTKFPKWNSIPKISFSKAREGERLHEFLITNEELPYCHDLGKLYKISKIRSKQKISINKFSSESSPNINQKKLKQIIDELMEEYLS